MTKYIMQRQISLKWDDSDPKSEICITISELENKRVEIRLFDRTGDLKFGLTLKRDAFLGMLTTLWPENVAYEFKEGE